MGNETEKQSVESHMEYILLLSSFDTFTFLILLSILKIVTGRDTFSLGPTILGKEPITINGVFTGIDLSAEP